MASLRRADLGHLSQQSTARLIRLLEGVVVSEANGVGWPGVAGVLDGPSGGVVGREMGDEDDGGVGDAEYSRLERVGGPGTSVLQDGGDRPAGDLLHRFWPGNGWVDFVESIFGVVGEAGDPGDVDLDGLAVVGGDADRPANPDWLVRVGFQRERDIVRGCSW